VISFIVEAKYKPTTHPKQYMQSCQAAHGRKIITKEKRRLSGRKKQKKTSKKGGEHKVEWV